MNDSSKTKQEFQYRQDDFRYWLLWQYVMVKSVAAVMGILSLYRVYYFFSFRQGRGTEGLAADVLKSFFAGFRFDMMVALYCCLPLLLLSLITLVVYPRRAMLYKVSAAIVRFYFPFVLLVMVLFCVVDFYYCRFFQSHISVLFFGIVHDDTKAVMKFVLDDYPVFTIVIGSLLCLFLFYKIVVPKFILKNSIRKSPSSLAFKFVTVIILFFLAFLGIRGTFPFPDSFPLRIDDATVSTNSFINSVSLNPVFAFKEAVSDLQEENVERDMGKILAESGFKTVEEAFSYFKKREVKNIELDSLFDKTPYNEFLEKNKPNVIFIQMESMSNHLLDFHNSSTLNLLGALESELPFCYTFRNAMPCQNGTIYSLEGLMLNTPRASISQSILMTHSFSGSCALPFFKAGYNTCFITGAKLGWRNIEQLVPAQNFSTVEGDAAIFKNVPGTEANEWGAYDEFLFERMFQVLSNSKKPSFIFSMTTTNHPRYFLPDSYKPLPVALSNVLRERCTYDTNVLIKNLISYQYANNCLGNFIKRVKASPFGKNTIIVATGDHNIHDLMNYSDAEMLQANSVPIIMYIPDEYKPKWKVNTNVFASHKDIFTTIYNRSLSQSSYIGFGNDLLQPADTSGQFFFSMNNDYTVFNEDGVYILPPKSFYKWKDKKNKLLEPAGKNNSPGLDSLAKMSNAYMVLANYYLQQENERSKK